MLGVDFNIITGERDAAARSRALARTGPRLSADRSGNFNRYPGGEEREPVDIISGKPKRIYVAPPAPTAESLRRDINDPIARTRPW